MVTHVRARSGRFCSRLSDRTKDCSLRASKAPLSTPRSPVPVTSKCIRPELLSSVTKLFDLASTLVEKIPIWH